jgi:hypothetical protein
MVFGMFAGVQVVMAGLQELFMQVATTKDQQSPLFKLVGISSVDILMYRGQVSFPFQFKVDRIVSATSFQLKTLATSFPNRKVF